MKNKLGKQLIVEVVNNNIKKVASLLKKGADVNYFDGKTTPLIEASHQDSVDIINFLINNGADIELRGQYQLSALMVAAYSNSIRAVETLLAHQANVHAVDKDGISAIAQASKIGNLKIVKLLHSHGANIGIVTNLGVTPLIYAAEYDALDVVKYLVENEVDLDAQNNQGGTALIYAIQNGHNKIAKYLIDKGADFTIQNSNLVDALLLSVLLQNIDMVKYLLKAGASVDTAAKDGMNPFTAALRLGNKKLEKLLEKAELNDPVINFHKAANRGDIKEAGRLLDSGVPIDSIRRSDNATALLFAIIGKQTEMVEFLVNKGANVNALAKNIPLLGIATQHNYKEIAEILLKNGAKVDALYNHDVENITSLMAATDFQYEKMVETLLKNGANPNIISGNGDSSLLIAVKADNLAIVKLLVELGKADVTLGHEKLGVKPIYLAAANDNIEIVEYLYHHGALHDEIAKKGYEILYLGCGGDVLAGNPYPYLNCTFSGCEEGEGRGIFIAHIDFDQDKIIYNKKEYLFNENLANYSLLEESITIIEKAGENHSDYSI